MVVDPFRSRTARLADEHLRPLPGTDAALAIGMMRAIVDAGLHDEEWCRAHTDGYDELLDELGRHHRRGVRGASAGSTPRRSPAWVASSPPPGPRCCGSAWAPSATPARRPRTPRSPRCRCSPAPGGTAAAAAPTSRRPRPGAISDGPLQREDLCPGSGPDDQHVPARRGAHRPGDGPAGEGARLLELEPRLDRARSGARARGARPRRPLHRRARAVHDRHRAARRRDPPGHHAARAPRRGVLVGPPLRDLERAGDRAARGGEAEHGDVPPPGRAARPRRSVLPRQRRGARGAAARRLRGERPARARLDQGRPRPGPDPACERRLRHGERPRGLHARYEPPAEVADAALAERFPLALVTPKTHLFLNSTFANQRRQHSAQPAPGGGGEPRGRRRTRHRGRRGGARVQRPRLVQLRRARLRRRPPRRARGADGLVERRLPGPPQRPGHDLTAPDARRATRPPSTTTASSSQQPWISP